MGSVFSRVTVLSHTQSRPARSVVYRISACQSTQECHSERDTGIERGVLQLKNKAKKKEIGSLKERVGKL